MQPGDPGSGRYQGRGNSDPGKVTGMRICLSMTVLDSRMWSSNLVSEDQIARHPCPQHYGQQVGN